MSARLFSLVFFTAVLKVLPTAGAVVIACIAFAIKVFDTFAVKFVADIAVSVASAFAAVVHL